MGGDWIIATIRIGAAGAISAILVSFTPANTSKGVKKF
jgi:hypothetical protein